MTAGSHDFECEQGATFSRTITYKDSEGVAINLTGYSARMTVRRARSTDADLIVSLTAANSRSVVSNATGGVITLTIDSITTAAFDAGNFYYDLETYNAASPPLVDRLLEGRFLVDPEIT